MIRVQQLVDQPQTAELMVALFPFTVTPATAHCMFSSTQQAKVTET